MYAGLCSRAPTLASKIGRPSEMQMTGDAHAATPVLMVPGWESSGPQHWQSLWERANPAFRRVRQRDWDHPLRADWIAALDAAVAECQRPPVLVGHSLGCIAIAEWASRASRRAAGALLVAPADVERDDAPGAIRDFIPVPMQALPFPSIVVASTDDPYLGIDRAEAFAAAWGSRLVSIGAAGHINTAAGFGEWPAGERLLHELREMTRG
jgi:predicted alpha/beta hydrolase family esterase